MIYIVKKGSLAEIHFEKPIESCIEVEAMPPAGSYYAFDPGGNLVTVPCPVFPQPVSSSQVLQSTVSNLLHLSCSSSQENEANGRLIADAMSEAESIVTPVEWSEGMTTNPGDIVWDPQKVYKYIYSGNQSMEHTNPLFYPGAAGVYYWNIIPKTKDNIKIYPDVEGIIVAVKQNEVWWDITGSNKYKWRGIDNNNCVWPPVEGNEWELVE